MKRKSFAKLFESIEKNDSYWIQKAILDFTIELEKMMKRRGAAKKDLANRIGTSQAYVTKIFRGNANFTIGSMVRLVRALDGKLSINVTPNEEYHHAKWFRVVKSPLKKEIPHNWGKTLEQEDFLATENTEVSTNGISSAA